ncbi:MAG: serine/threonine-protein kinase [Planctomycetota bacterium]
MQPIFSADLIGVDVCKPILVPLNLFCPESFSSYDPSASTLSAHDKNPDPSKKQNGPASQSISADLMELFEKLIEVEEFDAHPDFDRWVRQIRNDIDPEKCLAVMDQILIYREDLQQKTPSLEIPCRLGNYDLIEELGRGGMGTVYLGIGGDQTTGFAIKTFFNSGEQTAAYQIEAEVLVGLDHPNIVPLVDFGDQDDLVFLVMEKIEGIALSDFAQSFHKQNEHDDSIEKWKFVVSLLLQVGQAIEYAHGQKVLHRDIKPGNILVDKDSKAWLTDFGLSTTSTAPSKFVGGTPGYMAPEQLTGISNPQTDIFAFGITLLESLIGIRRNGDAFKQKTGGNIDLESLARGFPKVPVDLLRVVARATETVPENRYPEFQDLLAELESFLFQPPAQSRGFGFSRLAEKLPFLRRIFD